MNWKHFFMLWKRLKLCWKTQRWKQRTFCFQAVSKAFLMVLTTFWRKGFEKSHTQPYKEEHEGRLLQRRMELPSSFGVTKPKVPHNMETQRSKSQFCLKVSFGWRWPSLFAPDSPSSKQHEMITHVKWFSWVWCRVARGWADSIYEKARFNKIKTIR